MSRDDQQWVVTGKCNRSESDIKMRCDFPPPRAGTPGLVCTVYPHASQSAEVCARGREMEKPAEVCRRGGEFIIILQLEEKKKEKNNICTYAGNPCKYKSAQTENYLLTLSYYFLRAFLLYI